MTIHTVCFDLGGVLVRICHTWEEACAQAGLSFREPERMHTDELMRRRREVIDRHQRGEASALEYYEELSLATGRLYTVDEIARIHDAWLLEEYPGVGALLERLDRRVRTACLSNTNEIHWRRLRSSEFPGVVRLEQKLASHELSAVKPDAKIYEAAERALAIDVGSLLFFDDLAPNVEAARERGWRAEKIDPYADPVRQIGEHLAAYGVL